MPELRQQDDRQLAHCCRQDALDVSPLDRGRARVLLLNDESEG
jgi:hypothetical protein